jgi:hypothetical protein
MKRERLDDPEKFHAANKARTDTDANGIQQIPFASIFHWIAQQSHRGDCVSAHLPLRECSHCWNACVSRDSKTQKSAMDSKMPMPGFVFCLSVTDAIELNVDRNNLEAVAYAISLFSSGSVSSEDDGKMRTEKQTPRQSPATCSTDKRDSSDTSDSSFPNYMQPDAVYVSGIHMSKVIVRVHAMLQRPQKDTGLRFRYWQLVMQSLFLEEQQMISEQLCIRDVTCHAGRIQCTDYNGVCERQMLVAESNHKTYLPFTASEILDISLPSVHERLAVHSRLIFCTQIGSDLSVSSSGFIDLKTGSITIDINNNLSTDVLCSANEAITTLFPETKKKEKKIDHEASTVKKHTKSSQNETTFWMFQISSQGGHVRYSPIIEVDIPATDFCGKSGSDGLTFNTFLEGLGVKYGSRKMPTACEEATFRSLPETVRMHILVFLDDLTPLERVLQLHSKKNTSVFMRSHAINKKLSALKNVRPQIISPPVIQKDESRREKLLTQLQELDDDALENLLVTHCKVMIEND